MVPLERSSRLGCMCVTRPDRYRIRLRVLVLAVSLAFTSLPIHADLDTRAAQWNDFAQALVTLAGHLQETRGATTETRAGGYAGLPDFYREVSHFDRDGRLLARLRWESSNPADLHSAEVFVRDAEGRVVRDYSAEFLPNARGAPYQTLVNLHGYPEGLRAFRQFDASGDLLYEHCDGHYGGAELRLALESWDLPYVEGNGGNSASRAAYDACFKALPASAADHLDPRNELATPRVDGLPPEARLADIDRALDVAPRDAELLAERGLVLLELQRFDAALVEFERALELDDATDAAYFGRGMALGRLGRIDAGIADLTTFIERNPRSALAYTKRGVRHLWNGDPASAERDFRAALAIDANNAEAHDDLGVILAQRGEFATAETQFRTAMRLEPDYQKAHHNLALVMHLDNRDDTALATVDHALALDPRSRESLLLKGAILESLGRTEEAAAISARARALPANDWSERTGLR